MAVGESAGGEVVDLVPARMLNEHVYCPRLAYLEWVDKKFQNNADTAEGTWVHRRVDAARGALPSVEAFASDAPVSSAITISSQTLGIIAKIDVIEPRDGSLVPIEYKRGRPRSEEQPLWDPERVQICAQVLLLRQAGYRVDHAEVYFAETRTRHKVFIDDDLIRRTLKAIDELRTNAARDYAPPPLVDSPKCPRCSLIGICLPDEINLLAGRSETLPRRLLAADPQATPLYGTTPGSRITKREGRVVLLEGGAEVASRRLIDVSHIGVFGNVDVGSALIRACAEAGIPVLWFTAGGWFAAATSGMPTKNVALRIAQHRAAAIGAPEIAAALVAGKIRNARTLIRRHGGARAAQAVAQLANLARRAENERSIESMLGIEGVAARIYFEQFAHLIKPQAQIGGFAFAERNRRPPRDRINALLSFYYALLVKDTTIAAVAAGFDPYVGFYHRPRFGRPALALDLAEEFRPLIADSAALTAINNGELTGDDFVVRAEGVALTQLGRRKAIECYERRMATELRHPIFGYRASYRRCLELQARLLAAVVSGELSAYRSLTTR
jgi:CRISPR-associated protein Cas1